MFLYVNFRKNSGLIYSHGFHKEEKIGSVVIEEIKNLIAANKMDYGVNNCPSSKDLESFIQTLNKPTIAQLKELIQKYEDWAAPISGPAFIHDIQEHTLVKAHG